MNFNNVTKIPEIIDASPAFLTGYSIGSFSTLLTTYQTALSLTGIGRLHAVYFVTSSTNWGIKVTFDDTFVVERTSTAPCTEYGLVSPGGEHPGFTGSSYVDGTLPLDFKNSLLIEVKSDNTKSITVHWYYVQ